METLPVVETPTFALHQDLLESLSVSTQFYISRRLNVTVEKKHR